MVLRAPPNVRYTKSCGIYLRYSRFAGISFDLLTTSTLTTSSLKTPRTSLLPVGKSTSNHSIQTKSRHIGTNDYPDPKGRNGKLAKGTWMGTFTHTTLGLVTLPAVGSRLTSRTREPRWPMGVSIYLLFFTSVRMKTG